MTLQNKSSHPDPKKGQQAATPLVVSLFSASAPLRF